MGKALSVGTLLSADVLAVGRYYGLPLWLGVLVVLWIACGTLFLAAYIDADEWDEGEW